MAFSLDAYMAQAKKDYQQKELEKLGLTPEDEQFLEIVNFMSLLYYEVAENDLMPQAVLGNMFVDHFVDSIQPLLLFGFKNEATLLVLNAGVGFPAVPTAVFRPDLKITMVEEDEKKRDLLRRCIEVSGLKNLTVAHTGADELEGSFDYVVGREAATLQDFTKVAKKFVAKGGRMYCFETADFYKELSEITMNKESEGVCVSEIAEYDLAQKHYGRNLVAFDLFG